MKVLKLFFPAFAVFSSPQAPAVVCPGVVAPAGRDKGVPKVWGCGHMGQPCLAQEELVIQNSLQGTKITSAGSGAPFGGQGAGRAVFSCQSGLKGFAIIKFPRAKGSRAGRITSAENPTWDLWSGHYFKKKISLSQTSPKEHFPSWDLYTCALGFVFHGHPSDILASCCSCSPCRLGFGLPMELAGGGSCFLLLSGALLHLGTPGMAQPGREEDLCHSSVPQGMWAQQIAFPGASSIFPPCKWACTGSF